LSEHKQDETFKVVDRRLFTAEGELRKDIAEQQDREHNGATSPSAATAAPKSPVAGGAPAAPSSTATPTPRGAEPPEQSPATPKRSPAFENLIRSLGQNAAMLLGGYADPRTGQPVVDLEGAREMIDMLDALREKASGSMAPEEESLMFDILGNLKLAYMEVTKATAAAAMQGKAKSR
jgi:hypothetical protein